ncbi:MAG: DUF3795 domain-containing protein [Methanimicrococcus sp.]|nr:DUF3795 domain-containing protein [Methanimicrococcus sp.]
MLTVCGADCTTCPDYQKTCEGCQKIQGKVYWAEMIGTDTCPIYKCVVSDKKLSNCGKCNQLPCKLFYDLKDPSLSDEEHVKGIQQRIDRLKE